jgi:hypothetical protein
MQSHNLSADNVVNAVTSQNLIGGTGSKTTSRLAAQVARSGARRFGIGGFGRGHRNFPAA